MSDSTVTESRSSSKNAAYKQHDDGHRLVPWNSRYFPMIAVVIQFSIPKHFTAPKHFCFSLSPLEVEAHWECTRLLACWQGSTSGEFVPRSGISTSFGENRGIEESRDFFMKMAFLGIKLGKFVVTRFYLMWKSGCDLLSVTGKINAQLHGSYTLYLPHYRSVRSTGITIMKKFVKSRPYSYVSEK